MVPMASRETLGADMKTCVVYGDLSSEKSSENYLTVPVCDECYDTYSEGEDAQIVMTQAYDPSLGEECHFCDKTAAEEKAGA